MGTIECCQALDPQLKVSLNERRSFILQNNKGHSTLVSEFFAFKSKVKLLGDIFMKKTQDKTQFILQTFNSSRSSDVVNLPARIFQQSPTLAQQRQNVILETPVSDPNQPSQLFFMTKDKGKVKLIYKLTPFSRYEEDKFKRYVYEVSMHRRVSAFRCPYIHSLLQDHIIQSGIDKQNNDKCAFMIGDQSLATLHEIVTFRKHSNWQWTEGQFEAIMSQMIQALHVLHQNRIAHRDIRPHNIFYSGNRGIFMLSGFGNSKILSDKPNQAHSIVGVPYFTIPQLKNYMKQDNYTDFVVYDCIAADIYSLGVTLATTFFLQPTLPNAIIIPSLLKYQKQYPFLKTIIMMLKTPNISTGILSQNLSRAPERKLRQENLIQSLRYKLKPQDQQFVAQRKAVAMGYYHMFMYSKWANEINQVVNYFELKGDKIQLAEIYKMMAEIYEEHRQQQSVSQYYDKSSKLFCDLGQQSLKDKRYDEAIGFLQKGIECNRKSKNGVDNYELSLLLNSLAMVHHKKNQYEVARAFQQQATDIVGRSKGQNALEYAKMLLDSARIQGDFQQFKLAQNMLKAALKIVDSKPHQTQILKLKAQMLQALGNNYRLKAIERRDKSDQYRDKAQQCLIDALQISEKLQGNGDIQIGSILQNLGNVYFDKRDFHKAKKTYDRSLIIKKHCMKHDSLQIGQTLTYIANCYKSLKQYQNAIRHYDEAVEIFRAHFGNDHNANTAVAIGNIGIVYKQIGKLKQAKEYLTLGKNILKDLYGESSPDYQYFDRQL